MQDAIPEWQIWAGIGQAGFGHRCWKADVAKAALRCETALVALQELLPWTYRKKVELRVRI